MTLAFDFPPQSRNATSVFPGDFPGHVQHSLTPSTCCRLKCAEYSPKSQGLFSAACWKASPFGHRISRGCDKLIQREHPASLLEYRVTCSLGAISFTVLFFFLTSTVKAVITLGICSSRVKQSFSVGSKSKCSTKSFLKVKNRSKAV